MARINDTRASIEEGVPVLPVQDKLFAYTQLSTHDGASSQQILQSKERHGILFRVFGQIWRESWMAARDGGPGMNGEAKGPACSHKSFLFGLSLLATLALFEAQPAAAQSLGVGPFQFHLGGGYYRHHRGYYGRHGGYHRHRGGYHRRHYSYRYGHRHHGGGHRHHGGGHHGGGGGGGGHAPIAPL
jgi:hypothetical protein